MGWWTTDEKVWGDGPADTFGDALDGIIKDFLDSQYGVGRKPTKAEIRAGLEFSLAPLDLEDA